jgi:hypothetical protein
MKNACSITPAGRRVLTIESLVPFGSLISTWTQLNTLALQRLIHHSRQYEKGYLAWETVRKVRNPFFVDGTGFEGYYVGYFCSPEQVAEQLLQIGHSILDSNYRLYRFNHIFRLKLLKTLYGEIEDPQTVEVLAAQFGAVLGRLRCNLLTNSEARFFQSETYLGTSSLPAICYRWTSFNIEQRYAVSAIPLGRALGGSIGFGQLSPVDSDAGAAVASIGKFGHPLVRAYLDERTTVFNI